MMPLLHILICVDPIVSLLSLHCHVFPQIHSSCQGRGR
ncbi:unnamed protein product [Rhodiola kirilowii]